MEQPHDHPAKDSQRILKIAIGLTFGIFLLEFMGGLWTHSLALLSDAWHVFIDGWALIVSFLAAVLARRPVNDQRTFGLHRMEVFAAFFNSLTVFLIAIAILYAAVERYQHPRPVDSRTLLAIAVIGLALNLVVARLFAPHSRRDMNLRGAFIHVLSDALNTLAVIVAAIVMLATGLHRTDAIVSGFIALFVLWGSGRLLYEAFNTLLEGVPRGINMFAVEKEILRTEGVLSVHDLHIWSICSHLNALSGHILLREDRMRQQHEALETIGHMLKTRFGIVHSTIQVESKAWPHLDESWTPEAVGTRGA